MVSPSSHQTLRIVVARDRAGCGGGIHNLFEALRPYLGMDVTWLDVGKPHPFYGDKRAPWWQRNRLRWVMDSLALVLAILRYRPSLVHLNSGLDKEERSLKRDAVNLWIARTLGCKVLVQWHGWDHPAAGAPEFPGGKDGWLCRSYRKAEGHIVLASAFLKDLRRWGCTGVRLCSTVVPDEILDAIPNLSSRASPPLILFLSRVERAKGLWEMLDAYKILKQKNAYCKLTIAGSGQDLDALEERAAELGLDDVSFPGFVTGAEKIECYQSASIFCFPSHSEGMPLAVLEAMAMGLPVVTTAVGGLADILQDGRHGFVIPLESFRKDGFRIAADVLAEKLTLLLQNPDLRSKMGSWNREEAQKFAPKIVASQLEMIYREVIGTHGINKAS